MFYSAKRMKNGKWRAYKTFSQATTSWRGCNDKTEVVRGDNGCGNILNFDTFDEAAAYVLEHFKTSCFKD